MDFEKQILENGSVGTCDYVMEWNYYNGNCCMKMFRIDWRIIIFENTNYYTYKIVILIKCVNPLIAIQFF